MMVSFTHCSSEILRLPVFRRLFALLLSIGLLLGLAPAGWASTDAIEVTAVALRPSPSEPDAWAVSADFDLALGPELEEAVNRGLPLYFVAEFELSRSRWWWWDERVSQASRTWRLSYHALTRQYRVGLGAYVQRFATLPEALAAITRIRGWTVIDRERLRSLWPLLDRERLRPNEQYQAALRLRLDTTQLPKPLQMNALTSRDWNPAAEWTRFPFTPEIAKNAP
jgi:hypothetical protein